MSLDPAATAGYLADAGAGPGAAAAGVGGEPAREGAALPVDGAGGDAAAVACGWAAGLIQQA